VRPPASSLDDIRKNQPASGGPALLAGWREGRCDTRMAHSLPWYLHLASLAAIVAAAHVVVYFRELNKPGEFVKKHFRPWLEYTLVTFGASYFVRVYLSPHLQRAVERIFGSG